MTGRSLLDVSIKLKLKQLGIMHRDKTAMFQIFALICIMYNIYIHVCSMKKPTKSCHLFIFYFQV